MIYLETGLNTITLTLYEKTTQFPPYYTFQLVRKGTFDDVIFYQEDNSPIPYYWNSFTISVATPVGLTSGIIDVNSGEWTYNVYQMATPYDLDLNNSLGLVETGICIVNGSFSNNESYRGTMNDTITYYKNM